MEMDDSWEHHVTPLQLHDEREAAAYLHQDELLVAGQPTTATSPPLGSGGGSSGVGAGGISPGGGAGAGGGSGGGVASSCCESGRPLVTDPVSGQSVCSCQYDSARLALSSYPRLSSYPAPYPSTEQNPYPSIGVDSSAFYSPLSNPYALKDSGSSADMGAWTSAGLQPTTGYYPYDPTLAAYGYGAGYDLAARRKNATRESTATLKAWLNEHKKNPYPTKGEKIMLAIITKMTLTQVSTWFANARRRLKKENKMTWEPKNKTDDDDDAIVSDTDDKDKDDLLLDDKLKDPRRDDKDGLHVKSEHGLDDDDDLDDRRHPHSHLLHSGMLKEEMPKDCGVGVPLPATKPKIWSLADTAACKTPPPPPPQGAQQPWLMPAASMGINSFALPSPASGAAAPYSRYGGLLSAPYGGGGGGGGGGFPEVQTDTPPQTPPNMKLPSVAGNLLGAAPPASSASCFGGGVNVPGSSGGYGGGSAGGHHNFLGNFARLQQSPHKERGGAKDVSYPQHHAMMGGGGGASGAAEGTAFKPFYKSSQPMSGGFVSPV